jgi:hypothetical protein
MSSHSSHLSCTEEFNKKQLYFRGANKSQAGSTNCTIESLLPFSGLGGVLEYKSLNTASECGITFCSQHNLSYFRCIKRFLSLSSSLAAIEHDVSHGLSAVSVPPVPTVFCCYALFNIGYLLANICCRCRAIRSRLSLSAQVTPVKTYSLPRSGV